MESSEKEKVESMAQQVKQLEEKSGELERAKSEAESRVSQYNCSYLLKRF